jgi:hypothetical protein
MAIVVICIQKDKFEDVMVALFYGAIVSAVVGIIVDDNFELLTIGITFVSVGIAIMVWFIMQLVL